MAVDVKFIWSLFQTSAVREKVGRLATGTSGSMKNISQEKLMNMEVIFPPYEIQKEFAKRLSSVRSVAEVSIRSSRQLDALFASLQHRAFNGDL